MNLTEWMNKWSAKIRCSIRKWTIDVFKKGVDWWWQQMRSERVMRQTEEWSMINEIIRVVIHYSRLPNERHFYPSPDPVTISLAHQSICQRRCYCYGRGCHSLLCTYVVHYYGRSISANSLEISLYFVLWHYEIVLVSETIQLAVCDVWEMCGFCRKCDYC